MITVTTPATDVALLTTEELRLAVGLSSTDASQDTLLALFGDRAADAMAQWCGIMDVPPNPLTFREETITEVFRCVYGRAELTLSKRPVTAVTSVVVDATTYASTEYEISVQAGQLYRLSADNRVEWDGEKITVVYTAGYATVPPALKMAAVKMVRMLWSENGPDAGDPNLKRVRIEGVGEREYWVGGASDPLMSMEVQELLSRFREVYF